MKQLDTMSFVTIIQLREKLNVLWGVLLHLNVRSFFGGWEGHIAFTHWTQQENVCIIREMPFSTLPGSCLYTSLAFVLVCFFLCSFFVVVVLRFLNSKKVGVSIKKSIT